MPKTLKPKPNEASSKKVTLPKLKTVILPSGTKVEKSSGNVFADLGLPEPEMLLKKAQLVSKINSILKAKMLTQAEAGEILGVPQPQVSLLARGRLEGFTIDRLIRMLIALGHDVTMSIKQLAPS